MPQDDLYGRLGVARDATPEQIKRAYRRASKAAHPDAEGGSPERWGALAEAYDVLRDEHRRRRYDETGETGGGEPDNHQAAVMMRVVMAMAAVEAKLSGRSYASIDWVREIRAIFQKDIATLRQGITQLEAARKQWEKVAARAKAGAGKPNVVQQIALGKVRECGLRLETGQREIAELTEALALIEGATFDAEQTYPPQMGVGLGGWGVAGLRSQGGMW